MPCWHHDLYLPDPPSGDQPMSRNSSAAVAPVRAFCLLAVAAVLLLSALPLTAQCRQPEEAPDISDHPIPVFPDPKNPPPQLLEEPILPEAGFLSDSRYTSQFFGFAIDLPLTVKGHEILMPVAREREHVLLSLQYEKGLERGNITITALDPKPGLDPKSPEAQVEQQ